MLELPPLKIERDEVQETQLLNRMRQWLVAQDATRTEGIHASDLLDPRRAYWQWASPKDLTDRQVGLFIVGKVLHTLILQAVDPQHDDSADSGTKHEFGISYSPDWESDNCLAEIKTNRSQAEPDESNLQEELQHYLEQLCIYLVLSNRLVGELWILYLNLRDASGRTNPEIRVYRAEITQEQFETLERQILATRDAILEAKESRNPTALPLCRKWLCGERNCPFWGECRPVGRFPERDKRRWNG